MYKNKRTGDTIMINIIVDKQNINGVDFYGSVRMRFQAYEYYKRDGRDYLMPCGSTVKDKALGTVQDMRLYHKNDFDAVVGDFKANLLQALKNVKTEKKINNKCKVSHYCVLCEINGHMENIFDTMRDTPGFWKLSDEALEAIVAGINIPMDLHQVKGNSLWGYVEDKHRSGTYKMVTLRDGVIYQGGQPITKKTVA